MSLYGVLSPLCFVLRRMEAQPFAPRTIACFCLRGNKRERYTVAKLATFIFMFDFCVNYLTPLQRFQRVEQTFLPFFSSIYNIVYKTC